MGLVRVDCNRSEVDPNSGRRLKYDANGQPCYEDAIDGEDSPLQSKRSSRFSIHIFFKSKIMFYLLYLVLSVVDVN